LKLHISDVSQALHADTPVQIPCDADVSYRLKSHHAYLTSEKIISVKHKL